MPAGWRNNDAEGRKMAPEPVFRPHSSVVEHFLGKEEVTGSSPVVGSISIKRVLRSIFDVEVKI